MLMLVIVAGIALFVKSSRIGLLPFALCHSTRYLCDKYAVALCRLNICHALSPLLAASLSSPLHTRSLISGMVRQALDEQIQTVPSEGPPLRNFALHAGGANVIPDLTVATHGLSMPSMFTRALTSLAGFDCMEGRVNLPYVALEDNVRIGDCWEFASAHGYLGIQLSEPVKVSNFSVDYVATSLLSSVDSRRSPKDITLWGLVNDWHGGESRSPFIFSSTGHLPSYIRPTDRFVELATLHYDSTSSPRRQYQASSVDLPVQTVVVEVLSNYGAPTTCLYYVGVHGVNME